MILFGLNSYGYAKIMKKRFKNRLASVASRMIKIILMPRQMELPSCVPMGHVVPQH